MRFDRFLNVVYYAMLQRLSYDERDPSRTRRQLDQQLKTNAWRVPGTRRRRRVDVPDTAPSWWRGDEDASQTFLHAMGIVTVDREAR